MDEYNFPESKKGNKTGSKTETESDIKQLNINLSPIKNSPEDSPLRRALEQPPLKRFKQVGRTQDAGTVTDPDSLGPCEPGTAINLDGIVWNETKAGLLSLNITWRGKSFMGTLMDCSTTEHGSEWASPWVVDSEAPDQRPKVSQNKKKKSKKKRKKRKNIEEPIRDVSFENIEENEHQKNSVIVFNNPIDLVECKSDDCGKKFTSESALKYHVSFVHEKIITKQDNTVTSDELSKNLSSEPSMSEIKSNQVHEEEDASFTNKYIAHENAVDTSINKTEVKKTEADKTRSKLFASTQNIRPIVPVRPPHIPGSSLKQIQPKPTLLPSPEINLFFGNQKMISKKNPSQRIDSSPKNIDTDRFPKGNPATQSPTDNKEEPMVIDLSKHKDATCVKLKSPRHQASNDPLKNTFTLNGMDRSSNQQNIIQNYGKLETALQKQNKEDRKSETYLLNIPNPLQKSPKERTPAISVKTEFNTGQGQNLSDNTDQPQILKHTKSGQNVSIPPTSIMQSIFSAPRGYIPHKFLSSQELYPGLTMPPLNTNPLMLPGLMNMQPTAAQSSPFGSSLESLARAAEERARNFGSFSPAHVPAAFSPAHIPAALSSVQRNCPPPTSDSSEAPLLRHEHMHTHLHYITSPTHSQ